MRLTEREVDNDVVCSKLGRDIARRAREVGHGRAPVVRERRARGDVGWNVIAREEPDRDTTVDPLHCAVVSGRVRNAIWKVYSLA